MIETIILNGSDHDLELAAEELRRGGLIAVPTETVYGLAARGLDPVAVSGIYEVKERPLFDPLILHLPPSWKRDLWSHGLMNHRVLSARGRANVTALARVFWPGPLTMVVAKTDLVPDITTSGLPTVAVRIPRHPLTSRLLDILDFPLAAPSANRFGRISPTSAADVIEELGGRIPLILDGGVCEIGLESTVIRVSEDGEVVILRPGFITALELSEAIGQEIGELGGGQAEGARLSPGLLESHYAPAKPLALFTALAADEPGVIGEHVAPAILFFSDETLQAFVSAVGARSIGETGIVEWRVLSPSGDPSVAGRNLFHMLRELDGSEASSIVAELPAEDTGISHAIRDRLRRAAG